MTAASKRGKANRARGNRTELMVAAYLASRGYDAATTRAVLGHGGTKQPCDVVGLPGFSVEVKAVKSAAWPTWCAQAAAQADGGPWVVVRRLDGVADVGMWPCVLELVHAPERMDIYTTTAIQVGGVVRDALRLGLPVMSDTTVFRPAIVACRFGALVDAIGGAS